MVLNGGMAVRIRSHCVVSNRIGAHVFPAEDEHGALQVWVTLRRWEDLWLETPEPATNDDRLDFALGMVEHLASEGTVSATGNQRIVFVG